MIVCIIVILLFCAGASFASADAEDLQTIDENGMEPISVESMDSSQDDSSLSANDEADSAEIQTADDDSSDKLEASATFADLQTIINGNTSGSTIDLDRDYTKSSSPISISKELTLDGHGHSLDGGNTNQICSVSTDSRVVFKNIIFMNAKGQAVTFTNFADFEFINCTFKNNVFNSYGGAIYFEEDVTHGRFTDVNFAENKISNTIISNNGRGGGAIFFQKKVNDLIFNNTNFTKNSAENALGCYGGAIYYASGCSNVKYIDCNFINNTAAECGGAIYINDKCENVTYSNVVFSGNEIVQNSKSLSYTIRSGGAAIFIRSDSIGVNYTDVIFNENKITERFYSYNAQTLSYSKGAAIFVEGQSFNDTFSRVNFNKNELKEELAYSRTYDFNGGAIYIGGKVDNLTFDHADFTQNSVYTSKDSIPQGGAIFFNDKVSNSNFNHVNFTDNSVQSSKTSIARGGAIFFNGIVSNFNFNHVNFTGNHIESPSSAASSVNPVGGAIYFKNTDNVQYMDCTFINNSANRGGAIYIDTNSYNDKFIDVTFTGNNAVMTRSELGGGAIYVGNMVRGIVFNRTVFNSNFANYGLGGALYFSILSNSIFEDSNFTDNRVKYSYYSYSNGGAIGCDNLGDVNFTNVNFTGNKVPSSGGAIYYKSSFKNIIFTNVNFNKNSAYTAGAIYFKDNTQTDNIQFYLCSFKENTAQNTAGAVYVGYNVNDVGFNKTEFISNSAYSGGAICLYNTETLFDEVNFTQNSANSYGAAIYAYDYYSYNNVISHKFYNVNFDRNKLTNLYSESEYGGVVYISNGPSDCIFDNVNFTNNVVYGKGIVLYKSSYSSYLTYDKYCNVNFVNNTAKYGGAINFYDCIASAYFENVNFTNNTAWENGGAIYLINSDSVELINVDFINNAANVGGAIYLVDSDHVEWNNVDFINNTAVVKGGAIFINSWCEDHNFTDCSFTGNTAEYGAAIYSEVYINVDGCDFTQNTADVAGTIYLNGNGTVSTTVSNSIFRRNSGNVIEIAGSEDEINTEITRDPDVTIEYSKFDENYGYSVNLEMRYVWISQSNFTNNRQSAIHAMLSPLDNHIEMCNFENNSAEYGGAVNFEYGSTVYLQSSCFANNSADYGGAIYLIDSWADILDSEFANNTADMGGAVYVTGFFDDPINIAYTDFHDNVADIGGAVYADKDSSFNLEENVNFINNSAHNTGGAIFIHPSSKVDIYLSVFEFNKAQKGSAIDNRGTIYIESSEFFKNKANATLNAFYNKQTREVEITYVLGDNYFHAIRSDGDIGFYGVSYFEYDNQTLNSINNPPTASYFTDKKNITVVFYGSDDSEVEKRTINTNSLGKYILTSAPAFTRYVISTEDDDYYWASMVKYNINQKGDFDILQELIWNNTSGTIDLTRDYTYTVGMDTITEGIIIDKPITINGNGHSIDALFKSRIFRVTYDEVVLENIRFVNSSGINGAFIYIDDASDIVIDSCDFSNPGTISVPSYDGTVQCPIDEYISRGVFLSQYSIYLPVSEGYYYDYDGGAIYAVSHGMTVKNSNFSFIAANMGGSIYYRGENLTVDNSNWNLGVAVCGGAIYSKGSNIVVNNTLFNNSLSAAAGGSIMAYGENYTISNSLFINNMAYNSKIVDDEEIDDDPAIIVVGGENSLTMSVNIEDTLKDGKIDVETPTANTVFGGGAINSHAKNISIVNDEFISCVSINGGGAVYADGENTEVINSNFTNCLSYSPGGAIIMDKNAVNSLVDDCKFEYNYCYFNGGAIVWKAEYGTLKDSIFNNNSYIVYNSYDNFFGGAAFVWNANHGLIDNCNFTNNTAVIDESPVSHSLFANGGAGVIGGGNITVCDCTFSDNFAVNGGALYINCIPIDTNPQTGRSIKSRGGQLSYSRDGHLGILVDNCRFTNNFALWGGAVSIEGNLIKFDGCEFEDNTAFYGGAGHIAGYDVTFSDSTFKNNSAILGGAIISAYVEQEYIDDGSIVIQPPQGTDEYIYIINSEFINNEAEAGGAILWTGVSGIMVSDSHFILNHYADRSDKISAMQYKIINSGSNQITYGNLVAFALNNFTYGSIKYDAGGALYVDGRNGIIEESEFIQNSANIGGAVFWRNGDSQIINSNFTDNHAVPIEFDLSYGSYMFKNYTVTFIDFDPDEYFHEDDCYFYSYRLNNLMENVRQEIKANITQAYGCSEEDIEFIYESFNTNPELGYSCDYNITFYFTVQFPVPVSNISILSQGGAVYLDTSGSIKNSTFTNNSADEGGAVYWNYEYGSVEYSRFYNNTGVLGGAVYWNGYEGYIYNSTFEENKVVSKEIANGEVRIENVNETLYNINPSQVYPEFANGGYTLGEVERRIFLDIISKIYDDGEPVAIIFKFDDDFISFEYDPRNIGEPQELKGSLEDDEWTYVQDSTFYFDKISYSYMVVYFDVSDYNDGPSKGGAIYSNKKVIIDSSAFTKNTADLGGAVYNAGEMSQIGYSEFINNSAIYGGAIYNAGNQSQITGSKFINNSATYGGAIYNAGYQTGIISSRFFNNTASYGGAVYASDFTGILNSEFRENKAEIGSAVYVSYETIYVESSTFIDNQAKSISLDVSSSVEDRDLTVYATLKGNDNLINAFYVEHGYELHDVYYWSSEGLTNSDEANPQITSLEDGIDIEIALIYVKEAGERTYINMTNVAGTAIFHIPNLRSGRYYVVASHKTDKYYTEIGNYAMVLVGKDESPIVIDAKDIYYRQTENVTIHLNPDAEGNITVWLNGEYYNCYNLTDGEVSFNITDLNAGNYNITVIYNGSDKYDNSSEMAVFTVKQINSTIMVATDNLTNGISVPINVTVGPYDDLSGRVFITIEDVFGASLTVNGTDLHTIAYHLADGNYTITAYYTGDNNYLPSTNTTNFTVKDSIVETPVSYTINATVADITYLENATALVNVSGKLNGTVTVTIANKTYTGVIVNGTGEVNLYNLSAGVKTASVNFTSTDEKINLTSTTKFVVNRLPTVTDVTVNGKSLTINVTQGAEGNLAVYINGVKTDYIYNGTAVIINNALTIGNNTVLAVYDGNENYTGSQNFTEIPIPKNPALVNVTAENIEYGRDAVIIVNVAPGQTGYVTITVNDKNYTSVIDDTRILFNIPGLSVKEYPVAVRYSGDSTYESQDNTTSFNVTKADMSTSATVVGKDVYVTENTSFIIGVPSGFDGLVNITVDGEKYSGEISSEIIMAKLAAGDKNATVVFYNSTNYKDLVLYAPFRVSRLPATVTVDVDDVTYPGNATATVKVTGNANGTVIITVNGKAYGPAAVVNGSGEVDLGMLSAGIKNVIANFTVTDAIYTNATGTTKFAVNKANSTVDIRTENNDVLVNVSAGATGNVVIYVNGERQNFTFTGSEIRWANILKVGNNTIIAVYNGNENYTGSQNTKPAAIDKKAATVNVTAETVTYPGDAIITVRVGDGQTGHVTINVANKNYTAEIKDGGAEFIIPSLNADRYRVTVSYSGDVNYTSQANETGFTVFKANLTAFVEGENVTVNDNSLFVIDNVPGDFDGYVNITVDDKTYSGEVKSLIVMDKLTAGNKNATFTFYGATNYNDLTLYAPFTVSRVTVTATALTVSVSEVTYPAVAKAVINVTGNANGTVTVTVDDKTYAPADVINGSAVIDLGVLSAGVKYVNATFTVTDQVNTNATGTTKFAVNKAESQVNITVDGRNVTISVIKGSPGNLTVYVNGAKNDLMFTGENITLADALITGNNTIVAIYVGNENYTKSEADKSEFIAKKDALVNVTAEPIVYGRDAVITVKVGEGQTGHVTISLNNENYTSKIEDGEAVFTIHGLNATDYPVSVSYSGDENYNSQVNGTTLTVLKANLTAFVEGENVTVNDNTLFVIDNVTSGFDGYVNITVDGKTYSGRVKSLIVMDKLTAGDKNATFTFYGATNYKDLTLYAPFTVSRVTATPTALSVTVADVTYPGNATAIVNVTGNANGTVVITVNGKTYDSVDVINGYAKVDLGQLSAGIKEVNATFTVSDLINTNASAATRFVVNQAASQLNITVNGRNIIVSVLKGSDADLTVYINGVRKEFTFTGQDITLTDVIVTGNNTIVAIYGGNENYIKSEADKSEFIAKKDALVNVTAEQVVYGSDAVIIVNVAEGQTGHVTINVNGNEYTAEIKDSKIEFTVYGLNATDYPVSVSYSGDDNYNSQVNDTTLTVLKANLTALVEGENVTVNDNTLFVIDKVPSDFDGYVNITVDGKTYSGEVKSFIVMDKLAAGDKNTTFTFYGATNYKDLTLYAPFTVSRVTASATTLTVSVNDVTYPGNATAIITVTGKANGTVTVTVDGKQYDSVEVTNGFAQVDLGVLSAGVKNLNATFTVSDLINNNATGSTRFVVNQAASQVIITVNGRNVTVSVLKGFSADLTVYINGVRKDFAFTGQDITLTDVLVTGNNTIVAIYDGNENYTKSETDKSEFIAKKDALVNVTADPIVYGSDAVIIVNVAEGQAGHVTITVNGKEYTAEIKDTKIEFAVNGLNATDYPVSVSYSGDDNYNSQVNATTLTVLKANLTAFVEGENVTVNDNTLFVIDKVPGDFDGYVNITVDGKTYSGEVKSLITMDKLTAGDKNATFTFYGATNYKDLTLYAPFTVSRATASATALTVTVADVTYPGNARAFVNVTGNANGTVVITVNGKTYGPVDVINGFAKVDLGQLSAGIKEVNATFTVSDLINNNATGSTRFVVNQANSTVSITFNGNNVTVTVNPGETGKLHVYINGAESEYTYTGPVTIENALKVGENTVIASYEGSENYTGSQSMENTTISLKVSYVSVTAKDIQYGSQALITVNVPDVQTGYVTIMVDGQNHTALLKDGVVKFYLGGFEVSEYPVDAVYLGNEEYDIAVNKTSFNVTKADLHASVIGENVTVADNIGFIVSVPDDFAGQVNITVEGLTYSGNVSSLIQMDKLSEGNKIADVVFWGDSNYKDLTLKAPFKVSPISDLLDILTIKSENMTRGYNSEYDYYAAFLDNEGNALINTDVKFQVNGKEYTVKTDEDGVAKLTTSKLPVGTYDIVSINLLTGQNTTNVVKIVKRITENKDFVMDFNDGSVFKVKVWGEDGNVAAEGEIIDISANGVHYVAKVDKNGYARLKINLLPKKYTMITEYRGYKTTNKLTVKQTLKPVKKIIKVKKGKKITIKAKLKWSNGKPIKGKKITFKFKGKTYKAKTNKKGIAKVVIKKKKVLKKLKKGKKYTVKITYAVKMKYGVSTSTVKDTVKCKVKIKK